MWEIETTDTFDKWFDELEDSDRASVIASLLLLKEKGPQLARPYADTVKGSVHGNMKELRVQSNGEPIRAFFAFDPLRRGILLCAGCKTGDEKRFYKIMIPIADREFTAHLKTLETR
ncbi:type II toxin-antitoxin system RelE/ParE family toxin [Cellvibrio sp. PSBB023]|uniref:type II toxin-antitoxin system RelE/ParE family toxin n=1 Tax=Cellvibrio sp. PSBB023 TaxID=1945512 RepID=UPI00098EC67B|nr:type II toxin-antitoxin system RelE/ParE family toxin [Cellvibrio sp. PSBB023]AQT62145.1 diaminopimelate decarboxylase [Cellvibrio sp. PSBB023]